MLNSIRLRRSAGLLAFVLPIALGGCSLKSDAPTAIANVPIESTTFAPSLGVDLAHSTKTANGAYYRDITVGTGTVAEPGVKMTVTYVGQLVDGTVFDASNAANPTYSLTLGVTNVIAGWTEGLVGMKVGGTRQLVIPPELAYGSAGRGQIPPYAVLVFRVDLIGAQ